MWGIKPGESSVRRVQALITRLPHRPSQETLSTPLYWYFVEIWNFVVLTEYMYSTEYASEEVADCVSHGHKHQWAIHIVSPLFCLLSRMESVLAANRDWLSSGFDVFYLATFIGSMVMGWLGSRSSPYHLDHDGAPWQELCQSLLVLAKSWTWYWFWCCCNLFREFCMSKQLLWSKDLDSFIVLYIKEEWPLWHLAKETFKYKG